MRARQGLANCLWELERTDEAARHYWDMLRLNPSDNQGIRFSLLSLLLSVSRHDEAKKLMQQHEDNATAEWNYGRALLAFRESGPSKEAEQALKKALQQNSHVPAYLTGRKRVPVRLPPYIGWGDESEAVAYAAAYLSHWRRTPGAIAWLQDKREPSQAARKTRKGKGSKRGKGRSSKRNST